MNHRNNLRFLQPKSDNINQPLLVYLPGMDGTGRLFYRQIKHLENDFDIRCLYIPDGNRDNWQKLASQTACLIKESLIHKSNQTVYLCGESFGGCLALELIRYMPTLCQRVILANPAFCLQERPWLILGKYFSAVAPRFIHQQASQLLIPLLVNIQRVNHPERMALLAAMRSISQSTTVWRFELLESFYLDRNRLKQVVGEVILLASGQDLLLPSVSAGKELVNIFPQAELKVLPESGHSCLLEKNLDLSLYLP